MNKWIFLILILSVAVRSEVIPVDVLIDFETGSDGDEWSTTLLNNVTRGTGVGNWTVSSPAPVDYEVSTTASATNYSPFWIRSTAYESGVGDTRGFRIDMVDNDETYFNLPFTTTHDDVTVSFDIRCTIPAGNPQDATCDLFSIRGQSSRDVLLQLDAAGNLQFHTGTPSAISGDITALDPNKWYRVSMNFNRNSDCSIQIWDRTAMTYIGGATLPIDDFASTGIRLGNEPHGVFVTSFCYYDNIAISFDANAVMPLGPGKGPDAYYYVRTDGLDSNDGLADVANTTGTADQAWLTIQKAATAMSPGDTVIVKNGTYDEAVTISVDGVSGAPRNFIAYSTNVMPRNFVVTGDYNRVVGFYFTAQGANTNVTPLVTTDATGIEVWNNWFVDTGHAPSAGEGGGWKYGNLTNAIAIGNRFIRCGMAGEAHSAANAALDYPTARYGKDIANYNGKDDSRNVLIAYNSHSQTGEYVNPGGGTNLIIMGNRYGPTTTNDWGGFPHIDSPQFNVAMYSWWYQDNWQDENPVTDAHMLLTQYGYTHHGTILGNVSRRNGDPQAIWMGLEDTGRPLTTNHYIAHNIIANSRAFEATPNTAEPIFFRATTNNWSYNNIFSNVTTAATPYDLSTDGYLNESDNDIMYPQGVGTAALTIADPLWVNYDGEDLRPQTTSPAKDAGRGLTVTVGTGTSATVITVGDSWWFHNGIGITRGSAIFVGGDNNLYVTAVDRPNSTITVNTAITWANGEEVGRAYRGAAPDIGPYEFGDTLLSAATIANASGTYTVTPTGDARFVVFYRNGIPWTTDYDSPFTAIISSGAVTANAYALRSQDVMVFDAEASTPTVATGAVASGATIFSGGAIIR